MNFGEDINALKVLIDNTIARNPSSAFSWFWSGWMRTFSGEADVAIDHFEKSLRLDPRATRLAFHLAGIGICHFFRRRFDQAATALETSLHELPTYTTTSRFLISCYAHLGRLTEARELVARHEVRSGEPWLMGGALFRDDGQRALLFDGLSLARSAAAHEFDARAYSKMPGRITVYRIRGSWQQLAHRRSSRGIPTGPLTGAWRTRFAHVEFFTL